MPVLRLCRGQYVDRYVRLSEKSFFRSLYVFYISAGIGEILSEKTHGEKIERKVKFRTGKSREILDGK